MMVPEKKAGTAPGVLKKRERRVMVPEKRLAEMPGVPEQRVKMTEMAALPKNAGMRGMHKEVGR